MTPYKTKQIVTIGQEEELGVRAVYTPMAGVDVAIVTINGETMRIDGPYQYNSNQ